MSQPGLRWMLIFSDGASVCAAPPGGPVGHAERRGRAGRSFDGCYAPRCRTCCLRANENPRPLRCLLEGLMTRAGKVVPKEKLSGEVFGFDEPVAPNAIELYIARLRKKLAPDGPQIRTVRGLGYMIERA